MPRIAVVGAGQAGLLASHALHRQGHEVTLYSDRSPDDFLTTARPTGTAARFDSSLAFERELGLEHWGGLAPAADGIHLTFSPQLDNQLLTLLGRFSKPCLAIDVRLQSATWMRELEGRGARVEIANVDVPMLERIAAANDLTIVAAGRRELTSLFPRDAARSTYREPQRILGMVNVTGVAGHLPYAPWFRPVKFNFFAPFGEMFWVPWYSKDGQAAWSVLLEAKPGGPIDRFRDARSAEELLGIAKRLIRELCPWDAEWIEPAVPCDDNAWLVGSFVPKVREVVGTLPSGRVVMALGDTAQSLDPIGGQGANNGNKMTRSFCRSIEAAGEGPFDAAWMRGAMEAFWARHSAIDRFNNTLLEPLTTPGKLLLIAQFGSTAQPGDDSPAQRIANRFCDNFDDPAVLTPAFHEARLAKAVIREEFGSALPAVLKGAGRVGRGQIRQKRGRPAGHPGMPSATPRALRGDRSAAR